MFLSPEDLLDLIAVENGVLVYRKTRQGMRHTVGSAVCVVTSNGKPHYQIKGRTYNPKKLLTALHANDPQMLKTPRQRPLKPRDLEIHAKLSDGATLAEIGSLYGLSRQRIKQIADKLAAHGRAVHPRAIRQDRHAAILTERIHARYGDNYDVIQSDQVLRKYLGARIRAKKNVARAKGIEFSLTMSDLYPLPATCPVLGIPLVYSGRIGGADNAMALDRIDPTKGYIPGNVVMVSQRANRIKNDATLDELQKIAAFYTQLHEKKLDETLDI